MNMNVYKFLKLLVKRSVRKCKKISHSDIILNLVITAVYLRLIDCALLQDELLAKFVVNSHVKHHPNKQNEENDEDEEEQIVRVTCMYIIHLMDRI